MVALLFVLLLSSSAHAEDPSCQDGSKLWTTVPSLQKAQCVNVAGGIYLGGKSACLSENLSGLESLVTVAKDFVIDGCPRLTSLAGLKSLQKVGGIFSLRNLWVLGTTVGPQSLTTVGGLIILENPKILNLDGFASLTSADSVNIFSNSLISSMAALSKISKLTELLINFNPVLQELGLVSLISVAGKLEISSNNVLSNLNALSALKELNGPLRISRNNITSSAFQLLSGLDVTFSAVGEESWPCTQVKATGLPAPNEGRPTVLCQEE
jgi:hypothetical protein